jgi:carbon-monoxide dehydrogenase medium subunit
MKPMAFSYHRATSIEDAVAALVAGGDMARPLAGGQSLLPMLNLRLAPLDALVDISRIASLKQVQDDDAAIRYGALLTHATFEDRRVPDASNGLMPFIAGRIAYRAVRNRGTIGGSVALADPAADWVTTLIALDASVALVGPGGRRTVQAVDFVIGPYLTALDEAEVLEAVIVRRQAGRWGHYKAARKTGEYAESMAIALLDGSGNGPRIVVGATDGAPIVLARTAEEFGNGKRDVALLEVICSELVTAERGFSAARLTMHSNVAMRAIKDAMSK